MPSVDESSSDVSHPGTLVYLYGPPAVGKLTVARRLAESSGFRLFHNHLTVDSISQVFDFGSPEYVKELHKLRLDIFTTAAQSGVNLIFTNNSAWSGDEGRSRFAQFALDVRAVVGGAGGTVFFVQLTAPLATLENRLSEESRREHGKLIDADRLRELMGSHDPAPLHPDDLIIATDELTAEAAATEILEAMVTSGILR